jgi:L-Ala-D/L-Glu epimerase
MAVRSLDVVPDRLRLAAPFRIAGYVFEHWDAILVTVRQAGHVGRGEASGVYFLGDGQASMMSAIEEARDAIEAGAGREDLPALMPAGGARNAVDCALWELEASMAARPAWGLAGLSRPRPLVTTFTIGADSPDLVARRARELASARAIKLKLDGQIETDLARLQAVRDELPDVWLGVDANQGYRASDLPWLMEALLEHRVSLLEQPIPRGTEAELAGFRSPVPIAADESALDRGDLPGLVGRFDIVNIKLDKCGGLTEALAMAAEARRLGLGVMVGNMAGSSLAMAPAYLLGQLCDVVDLDGPTFLAEDRSPAVVYRDGFIHCDEAVWGAAGRAAA